MKATILKDHLIEHARLTRNGAIKTLFVKVRYLG